MLNEGNVLNNSIVVFLNYFCDYFRLLILNQICLTSQSVLFSPELEHGGLGHSNILLKS
jgi:hypothetical protein